ncbi:MAG TPA: PQQ-binding-like beta-propeller repeat protein [Gemmataceae bacterium]|nr:PQQ-binding-like beta-propeller repeat protein [Gemmataceae bacterium]
MMRFGLTACLVLALTQPGATAGDWPQWRGPERTGVSAETGLLKEWPAGGPPLAWKATGLGGGYSTPSVAGGRVFLMGSQGDDEYVTALDERDGRRLWSTRVGRVGENRGPKYPGPRSTPTVDGELLYTLGSDGDLVCVESAAGKVRWRHHLVKEFKGNPGIWAYAESVLIDGDKLICTPGGPVATMLALDKRTGAVVWKMAMESANGADYASATVAEVGGVRQYVQFLGTGVISAAADDGRLLWRYRGNLGGAHAAAPIFHDGCVFTSASGTEGAGGDALLRLSAVGREVKYKEVYLERHMLNHHGGVVRVGDYLYGGGGPGLVCMDFKTGALKWKARSVGRGALVVADGHLYLRAPEGAVALAEATPAGYREKGRFRQPDRSRFPAFAHPVVANGRLHLRDADVLLCYDVKAK